MKIIKNKIEDSLQLKPIVEKASKVEITQDDLDEFEQIANEVWAEKIESERNEEPDMSDEDYINTQDLGSALDYLFHKNKELQSATGVKAQPMNLLVMGPPGGGKTGIIEDWAEDHGYNFLRVTGAQIDESLVKGVPAPVKDEKTGQDKYKYLSSDFFDTLDKPNSILFIDEASYCHPAFTAAILTLVQDHVVYDSTDENHIKHLKGFVFTIAALNPADSKQDKQMNAGSYPSNLAFLTRFTQFRWRSNPKLTKDYLKGQCDKRMLIYKSQNKGFVLDNNGNKIEVPKLDDAEYRKYIFHNVGRKKILDALIDDNDDMEFTFSDDDQMLQGYVNQRPVLNARTLETCINLSDGTVTSFLRHFRPTCGGNRKIWIMVNNLLADLKEEEDMRRNGTPASAGLRSNTVFNTIWARYEKYKEYKELDSTGDEYQNGEEDYERD